jgi:ribonuclease HI
MDLEEVRCSLVRCSSGKEVALKIWAMQPDLQLKIVVWLWRWWMARNKANAGERVQAAGEVDNAVLYHLNEFAKLKGPNKTPRRGVQPMWVPPQEEFYKLNVDAAFSTLTRKGGWGSVARDSTGSVLDIGAGSIQRAASVLQAEALAAFHGLSRAVQLGMTRIILETDASNLGKALTTDQMDIWLSGGCLFRQIREMMASNFVSYSISICPRTCNRVADCMANNSVAAYPDGGHVFWCQAPNFVTKLVCDDLSGTCGL